MILEAYAKINWSLDITGVREDGYHYMDMLMQPVSLADEITLTPVISSDQLIFAYASRIMLPSVQVITA